PGAVRQLTTPAAGNRRGRNREARATLSLETADGTTLSLNADEFRRADMGTLTFTATVSVDGYAADADGDFNWSAPSGEVFRFHVERLEPVVHEVLGRRTYQLMEYWQAPPEDDSWSPDEHEFARRWKSIPRTVVSSTLTVENLVSERDRLVPRLGLDTLRRIVDEAPGEVEIFGPTTAAEA